MWAFFVAGSRAVLVSQWKVESASTTELMTGFHRRLAGAGGGKAEHLRQASLEVLRTPRYAHPFYWAGFVLVGDPY
jgi:CHAT domain-containing protein